MYKTGAGTSLANAILGHTGTGLVWDVTAAAVAAGNLS